MRAIWKGSLSFGLVNVPVKLYSATEDHDISLHQVHEKDGGRIHYERRCEVCNEVVQYRDIDKAYDEGDTRVMLTDDDLKTLPAERDREIEVVEFVPSEQVDPLMFDRSYFLEPDSTSPKSYVLLRRTLETTDRMAIVRFAMRQKTHLAALRVRDDVLVLQTLLWSDEVRDADFEKLSASVKISDKELALSKQLVDSFSGDFEPEQFVDDYQVQLRELIAKKAEAGTDVTITDDGDEGDDGADASGGEVIDLMEALRRSVDRSRSAKEGRSSEKAAPEKQSPEKQSPEKPAPRKAASKSASAKKAPAKKAPAKKTAATTSSADDETSSKKKTETSAGSAKKSATGAKKSAAGAKKTATGSKRAASAARKSATPSKDAARKAS